MAHNRIIYLIRESSDISGVELLFAFDRASQGGEQEVVEIAGSFSREHADPWGGPVSENENYSNNKKWPSLLFLPPTY